jgi:hypothetical protein
MAFIDDLARRLKAKRQELAALEQESAAIERQKTVIQSFIQGMEEAMRLAERSSPASAAARADSSRALRKGSMPARAYPVLKTAGRELYLTDLLAAMGLPLIPKNKRGLAGSLSAYARRGDTFTRPKPNTFGLVEWGTATDAGGSTGEADRGDGKADDEGPLMRLAASRQ